MNLIPAIAAALLLPSLARAQAQEGKELTKEEYQQPPKRGYDYKDKDLNKAGKILAKKAEYSSLDAKAQYIIAQKLADKLRRARKAQKLSFKRVGGKMTLAWKNTKHQSVSITNLEAKESDLDSLIASNPQLKDIIVKREWEGETPATPATVVPKVVEGMPLGKLFEDNDWEVLTGSDHAQALRDLAEEIVNEMGPKGMVTGMTIYASASRLRNTGRAKDLSFLELSTKRAEAARDFVREYIHGKYGISIPDDKIEIDAKGENGDGTSGPDWDSAQPREPYDVYKFVRVDIDAVAFEETPGQLGEEDFAAQIVNAKFSAKTKSWQVKLPRIRIKKLFQWGKGGKGGKRHFKRIPCPTFD